MAEEKTMRLSLVAKQINMGTSTILQFLSAKGHKVDNNPNAKLNYEQLSLLANEYGASHLLSTDEAPKKPVEELVVPAPVVEEKKPEPVAVVEVAPEPVKEAVPEVPAVKDVAPEPEAEKQVGLTVLGKIDLDKKGNPVAPKPAPKPEPVVEKAPEPVVEAAPVEEAPVEKVVVASEVPVTPAAPAEEDFQLIEAKGETLKGLTVLGKIELPVDNGRDGHKHKRKRIVKEEKKPVINEQRPANPNAANNKKDFGKKPAAPGAKPGGPREELSDKDIQEQIKATMARLQGATNKQSFGADKRRVKRRERADAEDARQMAEVEEAKVFKVTEFV